MSAVRFFLLGKFCLEIDGKETSKIEPRKAEELLGFLLLNRNQPYSRERLADLLWGETSPDQANSYLRKALWQLQSSLENLGLGRPGLLLTDGEWLQINPHFELWLDTAVLEESFNKSQGVAGRDLDEAQAQSIQAAVEEYRGDLLDGWYQDWCLYERERLQHLYLALLDKLMDYSEVQGTYENGLALGHRVLHYDRARERTHRRLMRLYYLAGDRTSALRQYRKCMIILQEELDVKPAESTRQIYEMIRADRLDHPSQLAQTYETPTPALEKERLRALFGRLSALHKELNQIQKQIAHDMQFLQRTIRGERS